MQGLLNIFGDPETLKGLLTPDQVSRAQNDALMQASMSLLRSGGPSLMPISTGQALADAYDAGRGAFGKGVESQVNNVLTAAKIKEAQRQQKLNDLLLSEQERFNAEMGGSVSPQQALGAPVEGAGRVGPTPERAALIGMGQAQYDPKAGAARLRQFAQRVGIAMPEVAEKYLKQANELDPPFEYAAKDTELIDGKPQTVLYGKRGQRQETGRTPYQSPTSAMQEYEFAKSQGYTGSLTDFKTLIARSGATTIFNQGEKSFEQEVGKADAKFFNETFQSGVNAQRSLQQIASLENLLSKTGGGLGTEATRIAGNFGVKLNKNAGNVEAAQAIINQLVPQQRPAGAGTMSDKDVELFKSSLPRLINTPEGNAKILSTMRAISQYDAKVAEIARRAMSGEISRPQARELMNSVPNPLSEFSGGGWSIKPAGGQ